MIATYAEEMSGWKDWQRGYRYGVLLLVPPEPVLSAVNALRELHDPWSARNCEAHVSLTIPFPRGLTEFDWKRLEAITGAIEVFPVAYGPAISFPPHPGVCLAIEPREPLERLVGALENAPPFGDVQPRPYPFTPHLTIAEQLSPDRTQPLLDELAGNAPEGSFDCTAVWLSVPDESFRFTRRRQLPLGTGGSV